MGGDMTKDKTLKLALQALEEYCEHGAILRPLEVRDAIKQALETRQSLPDEITDNSESSEYRSGWNDCRQVMMEKNNG
jgi:hypothetical protein